MFSHTWTKAMRIGSGTSRNWLHTITKKAKVIYAIYVYAEAP